ncbi:MAG: type II toxin-antitoxin system CcdA family antitoxin [Casimicrobiaceae bacterium]
MARKATNLSADAELLREAKALDLSLSRVFDSALRDAVAEARRARWLAENRDALDAYNRHIERDGVFSDGVRGF